ncbi:MAG: TIGR00282 family metallophosphoesterase [Erysipelotrichaceae bacterium]
MKILFLGDIVGRKGRDIVFKYIKQLQKDNQIDFTIVNAENSAHGKGITTKIYRQLKECGVDAITLGNHAFSKSEILNTFDELDDLIAPRNNLTHKTDGYQLYNVKGLRLCVANILGSAMMHENSNDAFSSMSEILFETDADLYFVDFHAEATAEKILFAHYFKNSLTAVIGTHTHVQTADERIMSGMAYLSDAGMCGVYDSVIGRDIDEMIDNIIKHKETRFTVADGDAILCGAIIEIDENTKRAINIERVQIRPY